MKLAELPTADTLKTELAARGYVEATPVQEQVASADAASDLVVTSQTGSGKTVAFGLAMARNLLNAEGRWPRHKTPRALVVAPTRELALQVARELQWLFKQTGARIGTCVGGMDVRAELRYLHTGVEIVVGTPGRIVDHLERKSLHLDDLAVAVLDEADEMLDMGFREELERILGSAPATRRTLMFSATFPKQMEQLAKKFTRTPTRLQAAANAGGHQDIEYVGHLVAPRERERAVVNILRFHDAPSALVFCATRDGVAHMHGVLLERGFLAVGLSGELSQAERNRALVAMREGRARVLVATDVAARGLDLPAVGLVVHADPPQNAEVLQHRSGRTGRAGKKGTAVLLVPFPWRRGMERMLRDARVTADLRPLPTSKQIRSLDDQRLVHETAGLVKEHDAADDDVVASLQEQFTAKELASVLARALRRNLPAPEDLPETFSSKAPKGEGRFGGNDGGGRDDDRRDDRGPARGRGRRDEEGNGVLFRVNVGRDQRADPKWLLPMLCRRGDITKRDIGTMDIGRRETRFMVNPAVAARFADEAAKPDTKDPRIKIGPVDET